MTHNHLRWGILGTANIARKNWKAIHNSGNATVVAVASRQQQRSRQFIAECQAEAPMESPPVAFGSYEELLASKRIDAVYIPLPTGLRKEWVLRAAAAGKHVVCEKPCATSVADLREMIDACHRHRVQFMDGVMFMHSLRFQAIRRVLDDPFSVGRIQRITSAFSFRAPPGFFAGNIRADSALEPHGCLGDLGWYCIRFALVALKGQLPRQVTGRILSEFGAGEGAPAVPTGFSGELLYDEGVSSGFYGSFLTHNEQWAVVSGDRGILHVADFVLPFYGKEISFYVNNMAFNAHGCEFRMEENRRSTTVAEHSNSHATAQETNLFRNFTAQVRSGQLNTEWPDIAYKTQLLMNACYDSACAGNRPIEITG